MFIRVAALLFALLPITTTTAYAETTHHHSHSTPAPSGPAQEFESEDQAQAHCPNDIVVWLNTNSGIYHEKGMRWYGRTKHGAYVCRQEANAEGDRDTRNGQ